MTPTIQSTGKTLRYFFTVTALFLALIANAQNPGAGGLGLSSSQLWYRAEDLSTSPVTQWNNVLGSSNLSVTSAQAPTLVQTAGVLGGKKAVFFSTNQYLEESGAYPWLASSYETFIIFQNGTGGPMHSITSGTSTVNYSFGIGAGVTSNSTCSGSNLTFAASGVSTTQANLFNIYTSGSSISGILNNVSQPSFSWSSADYGCLGSSCKFDLGRKGATYFNGYVAEVIGYSTNLNTAQRKIVQNYLAAKYGVAIYTDLYPYDPAYNVNLAGIGLDGDMSTQTSAKSYSSASDYLQISSSSLGFNNYLLFAHNGAPLSPATSNFPLNVSKLQRQWRAAVTNVASNTVNISIPQALLSSVSAYQRAVLLIDSDGDFTSGTKVIAMTPGASTYDVSNVVITNGDYISFGILNQYAYLATFPDQVTAMGQATTNYSVNSIATSDLVIDNPRTPGAGSYLIIGDNNTAGAPMGLTFTNASAPTGTTRTDRVWRINKTNDVGNVDITIDPTHFGALPTGKNTYLLLLDADGNFADGNATVMALVKSGAKYKAYNVSLANGNYVSFAAGASSVTNPKVLTQQFVATEMIANNSKQLCINQAETYAFASGCLSQISKATLKLNFNTGANYIFGNNSFSCSLQVVVEGYGNYTATGTPLITYNATLALDQTTPEVIQLFNITSDYAGVKVYKVKIASLTNGSGNSSLVNNALVLNASIDEQYTVNIPITTTSPVTGMSAAGNKTYTFNWQTDHCNVPLYQFQLLRLYNLGDTVNIGVPNPNPETTILSRIDWSKALTLETVNQSIALTLTEGTGYYIWRVRPMGNVYPNSDSRNWGNWSTDNLSLANPIALTCTTSTCLSGYQGAVFYYNQFDIDKNFIYNRSFTEDAKIHEGISFANSLLQVKQVQAHIPSNAASGTPTGEILANQTVYDFSGRPALNSLMAPLLDGNAELGYRTALLNKQQDTVYSARHFDWDSRIYSPLPIDPVNGGYINKYYSDNNTDPNVPTAENYPYSRTVYDNEGTGRVIEASGPGLTHKVGGGKTVRIQYGSVSDDELIRVFGDEAPDAASVYKVATTDQNSVTSIAYIDKAGKTIATCLAKNGLAPVLTPLASETNAAFTVKEYMTKNVPYGNNGLRGTKALTFTETTTLTLKYKITPTIVNSHCGNYCATCGYLLKIKIADIANPTSANNKLIQSSIAPGAVQSTPCVSGAPTTIDLDPSTAADSFNITLPAGKYIIEKIIELDPNGAQTYASNIVNSVNQTLQPVVTNIQNKLTAKDIAGLNSYLQGLQSTPPAGTTIQVLSDAGAVLFPNSNGTSVTVADGNQVVISTTCCSLKIPIIFPELNPCDGSLGSKPLGQFFEEQLVARTGQSIATATSNRYSSATFVTLINNMLSESFYTCDKLWGCWKTTLSSLSANNGINVQDGINNQPGSGDYPDWVQNQTGNASTSSSFDIITLFLNCAGYHYAGFTTDNSLINAKPYKYFFYDQTTKQPTVPDNKTLCENAFCNYTDITTNPSINTNPAYTPCATGDQCLKTYTNLTDNTYTTSHYYTLTTGASPNPVYSLTSTDYYSFAQCLNNQVSGTTAQTYASTVDYQALKDQQEQQCETECDKKYSHFLSVLTQMNSANYLGAELQTNPNFTQASGGWNTINSTPCTISNTTRQLFLESQPSGKAVSTISLTTGVTYAISYKISTTGGASVNVYNGSTMLPGGSANTGKFQQFQIQFVASTSSITLEGIVPPGGSASLYSVSIKKVLPPLGYSPQDLCCTARELVDYCKQSCTLTLVKGCSNSKVLSVGTQAEIDRFNAILFGTFDLQIKSAGSCPSTYEDARLNLESFYNFLGNANDVSGNSLNATVNLASLTPDRHLIPNSAYLFNGTSNSIDAGTSNRNITNRVTVAAWIKTTATTNQAVVSKLFTTDNKGYQLVVNTGLASFTGRDGSGNVRTSGNSTTSVNDGNWHHLVGVCDNGIWQIYVDGVKQNENNTGYTSTNLANSDHLSIGNYFQGSSMYFNGSIDEVLVYSTALNSRQIKNLYNNGKSPYTITPPACAATTQAKVWDVTLLSTTSDYITKIIPTTDGGTIVVGYTNSSVYSGYHGNSDGFILKLNADGAVATKGDGTPFKFAVGGNLDDQLTDIIPTHDGGYLGIGFSRSTDIPGLPMIASNQMAYFVKFDSKGNIKWQQLTGTNYSNWPRTVIETAQGNFVGCGFQNTSAGGTTFSYLVSLNSRGSIQWQKTDTLGIYQQIVQLSSTGGNYMVVGYDYNAKASYLVKIDRSTGNKIGNFYKIDCRDNNAGTSFTNIFADTDGGVIVGGYVHTTNLLGIKVNGPADKCFMKFDANRKLIWTKTYGGNSYDDGVIRKTREGGFIIAAYSTSTDIAPGNNGGNDVLIIKIDRAGVIQWNTMLGGNGNDNPTDIIDVGDGFLVYGQTTSTNLPATAGTGGYDIYLAKVNGSGNLIWQRAYGGNAEDRVLPGSDNYTHNPYPVVQTTDGRYVFVASSISPASGDKSQNNMANPAGWIVKIEPEDICTPRSMCIKWLPPAQIVPPAVEVSPIPTANEVTITSITTTLNSQLAKCNATNQQALIDEYNSQCSSTSIKDTLELDYTLKYHHYTLYYYDRSENLVKTVPPAGVNPLNLGAFNSNVRKRLVHTSHTLFTTYKYNSLGQLIQQFTPDGGTTNYAYNSVGQLRFSQNDKQLANTPQQFSYTKYDYLSRIIEAGKADLPSGTASFTGLSTAYPDQSTFPSASIYEQTQTIYSAIAGNANYMGKGQRYLDNRVSYSLTYSPRGEKSVTYYSYDPHGNVEWLVQDIPGFGRSQVGYEYDLISNKVTKVKYNEGELDQFYHKYSYDADNRITSVYTSPDGNLWDRDAGYKYYKHGALKRAEIGEDSIQGLDYAYTIQGWLKGINTPTLTASSDPGKDGTGGSNGFMADEYGMALGYYTGDFNRTGSVYNTSNGYALNNTAQNLYNGNIGAWVSRIEQERRDNSGKPSNSFTSGNLFTYDQLNRLIKSDYKEYNGSGFNASAYYHTDYKYDPNGNIQKLNRRGGTLGIKMDSLTYSYSAGTNRLSYVYDSVATDVYTVDIETGQTLNNYQYDGTGNMTLDQQQGIAITWNNYGKVDEVRPLSSTSGKSHLRFTYDAAGNRIKKEVNAAPFPYTGTTPTRTPDKLTTTYYVRDASGNTMGMYQRTNAATAQSGYYTATYKIMEVPIYGSSRLGEFTPGTVVSTKVFAAADMDSIYFDQDIFTEQAENTILTAPSQSTVTLTDNSSNQVTINKINLNNYVYNGTYYVPSAAGSFVGKMNRNVALAENRSGQLQFYSATPENYWGSTNTCLIYDASGMIMPNSDGIVSDAKAKPVIVKAPGTNSLYYLFTVGPDHVLYYNTIDMSVVGNGTTAAPKGDVISKNLVVDPSPGNFYNTHLALIENYASNTAVVYATSNVLYPANTMNVMAVTLTGNGVPAPVQIGSLSSVNVSGYSELQVSPDVSKLLVYNHGINSGWFDHQESDVYVFDLGYDYKIVKNQAMRFYPDFKVPFGTRPGLSADFSPDNRYIYYTRDLLVKMNSNTGSEKTLWRYDLREEQSLLVRAGVFGDLRRGKDGRIQMAMAGGNHLSVFSQDQYGALTGENTPPGACSPGCFGASCNVLCMNPAQLLADGLTGALPMQSHKIYYDLPVFSLYKRPVGKRSYEITDHLGNVTVVVSDERFATLGTGVTNTAQILSYSNYYAFGMLMPGKNVQSSVSYRYGYNGQEKDDDISSSGNIYTAMFWEYDTRTGRRWNLDPKPNAWESRYSVMGDNPIWSTDILGDKWKTKADEKKASQVNGKLEKRKNQLLKRASKLEEQSNKYAGQGKMEKAKELCAKADEALDGANELQKAQSELTEIGGSDIVFTFKPNEKPVSYTYMDHDGTVVIEFGTDANAVHELTHAYQHISGELELTPGTGGGFYIDITDEQRAYQRQYIFEPSSVTSLSNDSGVKVKRARDITPAFIYGIYTIDSQTGQKDNTYKNTSPTPSYRPSSPSNPDR